MALSSVSEETGTALTLQIRLHSLEVRKQALGVLFHNLSNLLSSAAHQGVLFALHFWSLSSVPYSEERA